MARPASHNTELTHSLYNWNEIEIKVELQVFDFSALPSEGSDLLKQTQILLKAW